jgi:hypothetical protein
MKDAVSDVVGAMLLLSVIMASSMMIYLALTSYFAASSGYENALALESLFNRQNVSVYYVQALPPSGKPGLVVTNYGTPVLLVYLVSEHNGSLSFVPENIYLEHGATALIYTDDPSSGVLTEYGALFSANFTAPMIPVSKIAINCSVSFPAQLEYVTPGYYETGSPVAVKWFVNGSYFHAGKTLRIYIDGPTSVTAVPVYSNP